MPAAYFSTPRPGCTCSTRGPSRNAISSATSSQEERTSTSTPRIVPIRSVPGGYDGRGSGAPVSWSLTAPKVPVGTTTYCGAMEQVVVEQTPGQPAVAPTPASAPDPVGSLSPSRAGDFRTCPLLFRLRT